MGSLDTRLTGVVLAYDRPQNLQAILTELKRQQVCRVAVWLNKPVLADTYRKILAPFPHASLLGDGTNQICFGRYLAAACAQTDLIYCQDDDAFPGDIHKLLERHDRTDRIVTYLDHSHLQWSHHGRYRLSGCSEPAWETLVGWGAIFDRRAIAVLLRYVAAFGVDDLLRREADRIFTVLQCRCHEEIERNVMHLDGAFGETALWKQPEHERKGEEARSRCRKILNGEC